MAAFAGEWGRSVLVNQFVLQLGRCCGHYMASQALCLVAARSKARLDWGRAGGVNGVRWSGRCLRGAWVGRSDTLARCCFRLVRPWSAGYTPHNKNFFLPFTILGCSIGTGNGLVLPCPAFDYAYRLQMLVGARWGCAQSWVLSCRPVSQSSMHLLPFRAVRLARRGGPTGGREHRLCAVEGQPGEAGPGGAHHCGAGGRVPYFSFPCSRPGVPSHTACRLGAVQKLQCIQQPNGDIMVTKLELGHLPV